MGAHGAGMTAARGDQTTTEDGVTTNKGPAPGGSEGEEDEGALDYTDPTVPGAASDAERAEEQSEAPPGGAKDPAGGADPDRPTDEVWDGDTLVEPGPGS